MPTNDGQLVFWALVEKPMCSLQSLNAKSAVVYFSFGDYAVSTLLLAEIDYIKKNLGKN